MKQLYAGRHDPLVT